MFDRVKKTPGRKVLLKLHFVKRWIKYFLILAGSVIVFGLVLVAVASIVLDNDDYRKLAAWGVERAAGYRMIIEGPFAVDRSR